MSVKKEKKLKKGMALKDHVVKYIPDEGLMDTPARLFRSIINRMEMNPFMWSKLLREHLEYAISMKDKEKEKQRRAHQMGNYRSVFFNNPTLTFNKLLEGLSILQVKKCKITIKVTFMDDTELEVSEESIIKNCKNSDK